MKRLATLLASFLLVAVTLVQTPAAFAASNTIGVNPRRTYTIQPGNKVNDFIVVTNNDQKNELDASVSVLDFKAQDNSGIPSLNLKENKETPWSLKPYLSIPTTVKVPAGKSVNLNYTISIPSDLGAGSYYSAVQLTAGGGSGGKNLSLSGSAVSLFFVTVPGKANINMQLTNFGAFTPSSNSPAAGSYASFFSATSPKYIAYDLKNLGNIAQQPTGSILINNIFGKQYKLISNANPDQNLVLIGQTRRIEVCINPQDVTAKTSDSQNATNTECKNVSLAPGRYTAKLDLLYGIKDASQNELKATATFWYLPPWFIIAVFVALLIIAALIWLAVDAIRNRAGNKYRTRR